MKLAVGVLCFNQLQETLSFWDNLIKNTTNKDVELLVIDNGSTDGTEEYIKQSVLPHFPNGRLIRNEDNIGVVPGLNQIYKNTTSEVIAIPHNDLLILEEGWDNRVLAEFEKDPQLGLAGFFGAMGASADGGRMNCMSNMTDAHVHGSRNTGVQRVVIFDGLCLIPRRAMLDQIGGFDTGLSYHHFYDKLISLDSHFAGWVNKFIGISCYHVGGTTANKQDYRDWVNKKMGLSVGGEIEDYKKSEAYYLNKYRSRFPVSV